MWYVHILQSLSHADQQYVGATANLRTRLADHNSGKSSHTSKYRPWEVRWYSAFPDKMLALSFETYLKSHSGRAFSKKRLLAPGRADEP